MSGIRLGEVTRRMVDMFPYVLSGGGHPQAAGVDFEKDTSVDDITRVVEKIDEEIRCQS
jgi:nanoRNase/pAp phosphatase (c-di-AMP/oligoRNAs hydrolase)